MYRVPSGDSEDGLVETPSGEGPKPPVIAGAVSKEVSSSTGGTVTLADDSAEVEIPVGALAEDVTITLSPVVDVVQPTTGMMKMGNRVYEIIAETGSGDIMRTFSKPLELTFAYWDEELTAAGSLKMM